MRQKLVSRKSSAERVVRVIRRKTRKRYGSEEKIWIVLEGLRGEDSIAGMCRREGMSQNLYCRWSMEFQVAGMKRLSGDTATCRRSSTTSPSTSSPGSSAPP